MNTRNSLLFEGSRLVDGRVLLKVAAYLIIHCITSHVPYLVVGSMELAFAGCMNARFVFGKLQRGVPVGRYLPS